MPSNKASTCISTSGLEKKTKIVLITKQWLRELISMVLTPNICEFKSPL
jgi:hypothetical protein